ncbi:MAG: phosphoribosylformylglycinamidine cyclo-ligase, partial [Oscillibacter sp.]|nr:phosphoribosylformylglycinamidine cyclo-ligase [Oscillibacter sp.]
VDRARPLDNTAILPGDVVIALPSSGLHSNGFSLVRQVFHVETGSLTRKVPELGCMLGEALLTPTTIYVKPVLRCLETLRVKGISHITGGGFQENIPRCLPKGVSAKLEKAAIRTPPIFRLLQDMGHIPERDMFNTFNMGVGMVMVVAADIADRAMELLREEGCQAYLLGEIVAGDEGVILS